MEAWNDDFVEKTYLDETHKFRLYWTNEANGKIKIGIEAETTGWLALGISPNGGMLNSDIMIGWVDGDGTVHLEDRYTDNNGKDNGPVLDTQNDLELISGEQVGGITRIQFRRSKCTGDSDHDSPILKGTTQIIYAWRNDGVIAWHGVSNRGSQSVNLHYGQTNEVEMESDAVSLELKMHQWPVSTHHTEYACRVFKLPTFDTRQHIIKMEPIIESGNVGTVHHILLYMCPTSHSMSDTDADYSDPDRSQSVCDEWGTNMPHHPSMYLSVPPKMNALESFENISIVLLHRL